MKMTFYNDHLNQMIKAGPAVGDKLVYVLEQILDQIKVAGLPGGGDVPEQLQGTVGAIRDVCEGLHVLCNAGSPYKPDGVLLILNHKGMQDIMMAGLKMAIQSGWSQACNDVLRTTASLKAWQLSVSTIEEKVAAVKAGGSDFDFACIGYIAERLESCRQNLREGTTARTEEQLRGMTEKATEAIVSSDIAIGQISYEDQDIKTVLKAWSLLRQDAPTRTAAARLQKWHAEAAQVLATQKFLEKCKVESFDDAALFELIKSFPLCKSVFVGLQEDDASIAVLRSCLSPLFQWLSLNVFGTGVSKTTTELQQAADFIGEVVILSQHSAKDWLLKNMQVVQANVKVRNSQDAYSKLGQTLEEKVHRDRRRNMLVEYMRAVEASQAAAKDVEQFRAGDRFRDGEDIEDERLRTLNFHEKAPLDVSEFIDAVKLVCHNFKEEIKSMASALKEITGDLCNPDMPGYWRAGLSNDCELDELKAKAKSLKDFKGGQCMDVHSKYTKELKDISEFQTTFGPVAASFEIMKELGSDKECFEKVLQQARVAVCEGIILLAVQSTRAVANKLLLDEAAAIAGGSVPESMIHPKLIEAKNNLLS
ncbi:unnamed protein product [Symbiodinium sp. CCMP2592]|nr:unnamed protein product [Symbiodinium sp. CCMP2592]